MSAIFIMTPYEARKLADALESLTKMTRETGIRIDAYQPVSLRIADDSVIEARWDDDDRQYIIHDSVGR